MKIELGKHYKMEELHLESLERRGTVCRSGTYLSRWERGSEVYLVERCFGTLKPIEYYNLETGEVRRFENA